MPAACHHHWVLTYHIKPVKDTLAQLMRCSTCKKRQWFSLREADAGILCRVLRSACLDVRDWEHHRSHETVGA